MGYPHNVCLCFGQIYYFPNDICFSLFVILWKMKKLRIFTNHFRRYCKNKWTQSPRNLIFEGNERGVGKNDLYIFYKIPRIYRFPNATGTLAKIALLEARLFSTNTRLVRPLGWGGPSRSPPWCRGPGACAWPAGGDGIQRAKLNPRMAEKLKKLYQARYRLYGSQILQVHTPWN